MTRWTSSSRHGGLDLVEELAELGSAMTSIAPADDPSGRDVDGGEQRCSAVPFVVMASSGRLAGPHRQHRLTAVQRLDTLHRRHRQRAGLCHVARSRLRYGHHQSSAALRSAARHAARPRAAPQNAAAIYLRSAGPAPAHFLVLTTFRAGQRLRCLPPHRQRPQFGSLIIAQYQGGTSPDRHRSRRCCRHPWHCDANLLRIYDCELVTRDTSSSLSMMDWSENSCFSIG
jgi:hypothetical protein